MESENTSVQEDYMLGRGFRESARLHLQHSMWQYRLGYLLYPSIRKGSDARVMDIGAGNACWLLDLADRSPETWQFQGVDISGLQYPASEYLPKNISLETMDVFGDVPDRWVEKFDIVHVRGFGVVITHSDPLPLLQNAVRMLKPGGYLQWEEFDITSFRAHAPNDHAKKRNCEELLRIWQLFARRNGLDFSWIPTLASTFNETTLKLVDTFRLPPIDSLRRISTDNCMLGMEEIGAIVADTSSESLDSRERVRELFKNAVLETEQGVSLGMDMIVAVGRKPDKFYMLE